EIIQAHLAARGQRDSGCGQIGKRLRSRKGTNLLVAGTDFRAAAGDIDVAAAELAAHIERGEADTLQPHRVEANADLALDTTDALDAADAADALQLAHNHVFHEPRQLLGSLARRDRRVGDNWKPGNVHALDQGLVNGARQIGTHARNRILNVVERAIA